MKKTIREEFAFLEALRPAAAALKVDFEAMREILVLKATLIVRNDPMSRQRELMSKRDGKARPELGFFSLARSFQSLLMSFFLALMVMMFDDPSAMMSIVFTAGFVLQFVSTIGYIPILVLDPKDATLLSTHPLDARTIGAAKTFLLALQLGMSSTLTYALILAPLTIKGLWLVIPGFLLAIVASSLLCVAIAYLLYGLVLRFFDGEKLKDLLSGLQIALSIITIVGYQLVSRINMLVARDAKVGFEAWQLAVPPMDLAWLSLVFTGTHTFPGLWATLAIVGILALHFALFSPMVEGNLGKLQAEGERRRRWYAARAAMAEGLARVLYRDERERAFWLLSWSLVSNDRRLRQGIYPSMVSLLLMPALIIFGIAMAGGRLDLGRVASGRWLGFALYTGFFGAATFASMALVAEAGSGARCFAALPWADKAKALRAAALNLILRFGMVPALVLGAIIAILGGRALLPDLGAALCAIFFSGALATRLLPLEWPHSRELGSSVEKAGRSFFKVLAAVAAIAAIHVALRLVLGPAGAFIPMGISIALSALVWRGAGARTA